MDRIGHYKIVSELGRGGMGVVYKAHEESLNRFVAIKVLGEHLEADEEYVERFVREAQSAAGLSHPNIVQIYAIAEESGHHYFVMEYVQGTSVQRMIQNKGKIEPADAARLVLQAASGLQDAHAQGVIHRDIKPANLMVTDRGLVKIADFGLVLIGSATTRLTATGMLMGTPGYLSPEQCLDQGPDHRTDIYSLGVTLFEMVTGTMPFTADSPLALLKQIVEVEPPDICELNPEVDDELRTIIATMLAKEREERYSSCTEVIAAVQSWLEARGEPLQSPAEGIASGSAAGVLPPPPPPMTEEEINTQPTVAVPSGATPEGPPPPPSTEPVPEAEAPVARPTAPAAVATAPTTQPPPPSDARGGRTGLIVAAIIVFVLAGGSVAAFLTLKSGVLDGLLDREKQKVTSIQEDVAASPVVVETEAATESLAGDDASTAGDVTAVDDQEEPVQSEGPAVHQEPTDAIDTKGPSPSSPTKADDSPKRLADAETTGTTPSGQPEPETQKLAPPPTGTVVLAVGDRFLATEAETYIKKRLRRAGVEIVEVTQIPGFEGLLNTESRPAPEQVRTAIRPYARYLVPLRVDYLGSREVYVMGRRELVHQSRVNIAAVDLATGRPLGKPATFKVEYTQLNADEVVGRELRRSATGLLQLLPRR